MPHPSPRIMDRLAPIEVQSPDGRHVALGDLIADRLSVIVFVRHFG